MSDINMKDPIFYLETVDNDSINIHYIRIFDHYIFSITKGSVFWEENKKYFQEDFDLLRKIIIKSLIKKESNNISYELVNDNNNDIIVNIKHISDLGLSFEISFTLESYRKKYIEMENKIKELENKLNKESIEKNKLKLRMLNEEKNIIIENTSEKYRRYSSILEGFNKSYIDSNTCWSPLSNDTNQWMMINLEKIKEIRGFIIMGRYNSFNNEQVTEVDVFVSNDYKVCEKYKNIECQSIDTEKRPFETFYNPKRKIIFDDPLKAKFIKFVPKKWMNNISMRIGLLIKYYDTKNID